MATWLRASTAVDVMLGPALDSVDGNTVEGSLTITQPDIRLSKNGGAFAQKSAAQTLSHGENGWYPANLSTTDTNTLGVLIVVIHESGALQIWREFMVVPANVYDSFFSTDFLQVDATQLLGTAFATPTVAGVIEADQTHYLGSAAPALVGGRYDSSVGAMAANTITAAATATDYLAEINAEADTALADYDGPTFAELDARTDAIEADTQDIQSRLPAALVSGRVDASVGAVAANAITATSINADAITAAKIAADAITAAKVADGTIDAATMAADMNSYTTRSWLGRQGTTADKYIVQWFKNGQLITSGITVPLIRVFDDDGTDLIGETAMTEIGGEQCFKFVESTDKLTPGDVYIMQVKATIDGSVRIDRQPVMRDSA